MLGTSGAECRYSKERIRFSAVGRRFSNGNGSYKVSVIYNLMFVFVRERSSVAYSDLVSSQ